MEKWKKPSGLAQSKFTVMWKKVWCSKVPRTVMVKHASVLHTPHYVEPYWARALDS
ncbi:hypothetical protein Acr_12g0003640 [Actinidia rufa]|uniref:Uncharacterized protein n=1 Tax=Actinidia rufa TaxID=165716 RepID=A0A7J0FGW1_9ERIC|nr:hypothetical protein Acr_12g0003640 [Actinidia rufa]